MNLLAIVNRARRECGVSGTALPTLQNGLTMEGQRFVDWASDAWNDLQLEKPDWQWMRKTTTFAVPAGQTHFTLAESAPDCADWKTDSFRVYSAVTGTADEQVIPYLDYDVFRNLYMFGASRTATGRPVIFSHRPDKTLVVGPVPDTAYMMHGEYFRQPTKLTLDADDPAAAGNDFPERYHMLLVYMVMDSYAGYESAAEVAQRAQKGRTRLRAMIMRDYLPDVHFGAPLA